MSDRPPPSGRPRPGELQRSRGRKETVAGELQEFEHLRAAEYLSRLAADDDLIRLLQLSGFDTTTSEWKQFARALVEYGYGVFRAWFGTGEIVGRLARRGVRGRSALPSPYYVDADAEHELAAELVVRGIKSFRTNVLLEGRWKADGGATLKTYFVGHLLFMVPAIFRDWRGARERATSPTEVAISVTPSDRVDLRLVLDEVCDVLTPELAAMFRQRANGQSVAEIANTTGITIGKVKTDMMRARKRLARLYPEANEWIS